MPLPGHAGADLAKLATDLIQNGPKKTLSTSRRVRVVKNHAFIVDVTDALFVWEHDAYPQYYITHEDLKNCRVTDKQPIHHGGKTLAAIVNLTVPSHDGLSEATTDRVIRFAKDDSLGPLSDKVRLEFSSMDQWLEEDTPIYVHPKDPFKRIEILASQRPIEIAIHGQTVAKSTYAMHLLETSLPTRYYVPLTSVDLSVLRKSDLVTQCPYKGSAEYYNVVVNGEELKNIVWYYRTPTHESAVIANLVCFYNEKVDIILDGKQLKRPKTHFV